jgi:hypothetical protein
MLFRPNCFGLFQKDNFIGQFRFRRVVFTSPFYPRRSGSRTTVDPIAHAGSHEGTGTVINQQQA